LDNCRPTGLLEYVHKPRYDETPLKLRSSGAPRPGQLFTLALLPNGLLDLPSASASIEPLRTISLKRHLWVPTDGEQATTTAEACKVVQFESTNAVLIEPEPDHFIGITAHFADHLSAVERCSATCLRDVCCKHACVTPASSHYVARLAGRTQTTIPLTICASAHCNRRCLLLVGSFRMNYVKFMW
jgi:hypothetical protein